MLLKKSLISFSVAVAVGLFGFSSVSASDSAGKRVWDSLRSEGVSTHTTRARSFESRYGRHWTGGQASVRIRQSRPRNIVNFAPPRLDTGCSGIDLYAGSFSLISGDEIVQMYRGAMSGAASYFFGLAVQSLCPACFAQAESIQKRLQEFNDMMRMDCQRIATSDWGQGAATRITETATSIRESTSRSLGFSDGTNTIRGDSMGPNNTPPDILRMTNANIVVDIVAQLNSVSAGSFAGYMRRMGTQTNASTHLDGVIPDENLRGAAIMLMSLMGTYYIRAVEDADECQALIDSGQECIRTDKVSPTITFSDLAFGRTDGYVLNGCKNSAPDCAEVEKYEFNDALQGIFDFTKDLIAGSGSDVGLIELLHSTSDRSTIANSPQGEHMMFLVDNFNYPWMNLALATRRGGGYSIDTVAEIISLNITERFITELKRELDRILFMRRTDPAGVNLTKDFEELFRGLDASFNEFKSDVRARYDSMSANLKLNAQLNEILRGR